MQPKSAFITGITGQDGSYLAELLLSKGYQVHGLIRRSSTFSTDRIEHLYKDPHEEDVRLRLHYGDITDGTGLVHLLDKIHPDEIYHLAAQSHVGVSFQNPVYSVQSVAMGTLNLLEAIRTVNPKTRFYHAASSEMFGNAPAPQSESTPFQPRSPYACAKVFGFHQTVNYREAYGLFACNGILFNHESPRRGETFVTRKITRAATRIKLGLQRELFLGNLDARRDWGFAGDYVDAMWRMLQQPKASDYVIATGETHSVREFLEEVFGVLGLAWAEYVKIDSKYLRPSEVLHLQGDASRAKRELNWEPTVNFKKLVKLMVDADLVIANQEKLLATHDQPNSSSRPFRVGR